MRNLQLLLLLPLPLVVLFVDRHGYRECCCRNGCVQLVVLFCDFIVTGRMPAGANKSCAVDWFSHFFPRIHRFLHSLHKDHMPCLPEAEVAFNSTGHLGLQNPQCLANILAKVPRGDGLSNGSRIPDGFGHVAQKADVTSWCRCFEDLHGTLGAQGEVVRDALHCWPYTLSRVQAALVASAVLFWCLGLLGSFCPQRRGSTFRMHE